MSTITITFIPCTIVNSGYAGKCGVRPLANEQVARLLRSGAITHEALEQAEDEAYAAFVEAGNFPGYIPALSRVEVSLPANI